MNNITVKMERNKSGLYDLTITDEASKESKGIQDLTFAEAVQLIEPLMYINSFDGVTK